MRVVDDDRDRADRGQPAKRLHAGPRDVRAQDARGRAKRFYLDVISGDPSERKRHARVRIFSELTEPVLEDRAASVQRTIRRQLERLAQKIGERPVGAASQRLARSKIDDRRPVERGPQPAHELEREPCLADARFAEKTRDAGPALGCRRSRVALELNEELLAADERNSHFVCGGLRRRPVGVVVRAYQPEEVRAVGDGTGAHRRQHRAA